MRRRRGADVKFVGVCHSDIHQVNDDWGGSLFPMVPGHEIAGIVTEVGSAATRFTVGDRVGVGCFVDSCGECENCVRGEAQLSLKGAVFTYDSLNYNGSPNYGG